ncbi:Ig-like domain-containing protein [Terrabacter sp. BE26]|uniref:Ig-like domain-containing protein n=1 Tax=Terrabacter sp. BE26 TaxID=2898152 RepID=UPI0035BE193D
MPKTQPERQLAPNSCLNYVPDGTQTYTAKVRDSSGSPVAGVVVSWSDSDAQDALFRVNQNPCVTNSAGSCSAELVDRHPKAGEKITVTASVKGASGTGFLTFRR